MKITNEHIRILAAGERQMDAGEVPFVVNEGGRLMVTPQVMEELGLETGQTVSNQICIAICEANIAALNAQLETEKVFNTPVLD